MKSMERVADSGRIARSHETPNGGNMPEPVADKLTLGQVSINKDAFELDLQINDGYKAFSAELLRLALLILTGLSAVWLKVYLPNGHAASVPFRMSILFLSAFGSAALSAGAALMHRYASSDSLAYHVSITVTLYCAKYTALQSDVSSSPLISDALRVGCAQFEAGIRASPLR
jgi:hypothetical protein